MLLTGLYLSESQYMESLPCFFVPRASVVKLIVFLVSHIHCVKQSNLSKYSCVHMCPLQPNGLGESADVYIALVYTCKTLLGCFPAHIFSNCRRCIINLLLHDGTPHWPLEQATVVFNMKTYRVLHQQLYFDSDQIVCNGLLQC